MHAVPRRAGARGPVLIHDLLAEHFGALALEDLVVAREKFPLWMRADIQCGIEQFVAEFPGHRFTGARVRGQLGFRFPNLIEEGEEEAIAVGPAVWSPLDIGEAKPVRCLLRGLWLAAHGGTPFALLLDLDDEGEYGTRLRIELATPAGVEPEQFADSVLARLGMQARKGVLLYGPPGTGKTLVVRYRRAAQAMLERGGNELRMEDFERALGDMVGSGGKLSARLAGAEGVVGFV